LIDFSVQALAASGPVPATSLDNISMLLVIGSIGLAVAALAAVVLVLVTMSRRRRQQTWEVEEQKDVSS
jgi:heme/copper-type cytochrome/quinol oxidase subunit 2